MDKTFIKQIRLEENECKSDEDKRAYQIHNLKFISKEPSLNEFVTIHKFISESQKLYSINSMFISKKYCKKVIAKPDWCDIDLCSINESNKSYLIEKNKEGRYYDDMYEDRKYCASYQAEYIYFERENILENKIYYEINQNFIHFFKLHYENDSYYSIDDMYNKITVIKIDGSHISIRLEELKIYCAINKLVIIQLFGFDEIGLETKIGKKIDNNFCFNNIIYKRYFSDFDKRSILFGKKIIKPMMPISQLYQESKFETFMYGIDDNGQELSFKCDEKELANKNNPHFLTPIYFSKNVLDRYRNNPNIFKIDYNYISCSKWYLRVDNEAKDKIIVFLGELGRLPYDEQKYWKSFNILPAGTISDVFFQQQLMGAWVDSSRADIRFRRLYNDVKLYRKLHIKDEYRLDTLSTDINNSEKDLDYFIDTLHKLVIEFLDSDLINTLITKYQITVEEGRKSISKLESIFKHNNLETKYLDILHSLHKYRNKFSGHAKGSDYDKICSKLQIGKKSNSKIAEEIITEVNKFLEYIKVNSNIFAE